MMEVRHSKDMTVVAAKPAADQAMCTLPALTKHSLPVNIQTQIAYFDAVLSCSKRTDYTLLSRQHNSTTATAQGASHFFQHWSNM